MELVTIFLEESQHCADALSCMQSYAKGCSLMASLGEKLAKAEQSVAILETSYIASESAAKAQVMARRSNEYYTYRTMKAQFSSLDAALIGLRHKAQALANEFNHLKNEPKI